MHKHSLLIPIGCGVTLLHGGLLVLLFFVYRDTIEHLNLMIMPSVMARDIEFRVAIERGTVKGSGAKNGAGAAIASPKIAPAKKSSGPKTQIGALPAKKQPSKDASKKKGVDKIEKKKEVVAPVKKIEEKPTPAKEQVKEQVVEKAQPAVTPVIPEHLDLSVGKAGVIEGDSSLVFFEAEYKALYENISDQWAPPAGVPAEAACVITIVLDREGDVDDMLVEKSSGMLVFDVAARAAISDVEFPRFAWGKSITITFSV